MQSHSIDHTKDRVRGMSNPHEAVKAVLDAKDAQITEIITDLMALRSNPGGLDALIQKASGFVNDWDNTDLASVALEGTPHAKDDPHKDDHGKKADKADDKAQATRKHDGGTDESKPVLANADKRDPAKEDPALVASTPTPAIPGSDIAKPSPTDKPTEQDVTDRPGEPTRNPAAAEADKTTNAKKPLKFTDQRP
jgi:hypothetical protein